MFKEWDNEENSIHKLEFSDLHNSAYIIWEIHLQLSTIGRMCGEKHKCIQNIYCKIT